MTTRLESCSLAEPETRQLLRWRLGSLRESGYSWEQSIRLALRSEIDLHTACELRARGCPERTALRILL